MSPAVGSDLPALPRHRIGAYFLLRQPSGALPLLWHQHPHRFHFCPQCAYQVSAACGNCYRGVRITDLYCVYCGHSLASDDVPSRLRAFNPESAGIDRAFSGSYTHNRTKNADNMPMTALIVDDERCCARELSTCWTRGRVEVIAQGRTDRGGAPDRTHHRT